jgi:phenylacetate-CoA ligase
MRNAPKVAQELRELTRVLLVPERGLDFDAARARILRDFRDRLGADVQVAVELVAAIAPEASGKFRYVVSRVAR